MSTPSGTPYTTQRPAAATAAGKLRRDAGKFLDPANLAWLWHVREHGQPIRRRDLADIHVRGTLGDRASHDRANRFIPAGAGNAPTT